MQTSSALGEHGLAINDEQFLTQGQQRIFAGHITDQHRLADNDRLLENWATTYRDVFGHGQPVDKTSWGEYLRCGCGTTRSIEAVYNRREYNYLGTLEKDAPLATEEKCPNCGSVLDFFYGTQDLISEIRTRLTQEKFSGAFLVNEQSEIHGFFYAWITTIERLWREKLARYYAHSNLTFEDLLRQLAENSDGKLKANTPVFWLAECGQTLPSRHPETFFAMLRQLFQFLPEDTLNLPTLVSTMPKVRSYLFLRASGCEPVVRTPDLPLEVLAGSAKRLRAESSSRPKDFQDRHRQKLRTLIKGAA